MIRRLYDWTLRMADHHNALWVLALISFAEASVFPIPPDLLMIPMIIEAARALEEGIAETANEVDMGLIMGIGFPPFRGGALKYADEIGMQNILDKCAKYADLGKLYEPTESMKQMAADGKSYFGS